MLNRPNSFDAVINNSGGDCEDLVLVMIRLLKSAGIQAHPAVTSTTQWHPFRMNSSNLSHIDHIIVYIPKYNHYIDPTARDAEADGYLTEQQVLDVVTNKVLEPTKAEIGPLI